MSEHEPITAPIASSRWGLYSPVLITLLLLSIVRFFQVSGVATVYTFFNVYMDTELAVPTSQIGLVAAFARLIGVFAALSTPLLVTRWGAALTVLFASIIGTVSILPLALIPLWPAAGLGYIGITAISSMRFPAYMIYSTALVPPNWRGTLAGMGEFAGGLSFAGLAFIGGSMVEAQGFTPLFLLGGALTLVGTLLFYLWFMFPRSKRVPSPVA
jgi:predicted MFS family arabinose efflux permease